MNDDVFVDPEPVRVENKKKTHQMGILSCTSYVVGSIIGTGIFITANEVLISTNSVGLDLLVWFLCGLTSLIGSLVYIELATAIPETGCDFAYTVYVGWEACAFAFMWISTLVSYPASAAVQAKTFGLYIMKGFKLYFDIAAWVEWLCIFLLAFFLLAFLTVLNFFSVSRVVGRFQTVSTIVKVIVIALILITGISHLFISETAVAEENFSEPFKDSNWIGLGQTFYMGLFAYAGWEVLNYGTPEIKNPSRTMPLSLVGGIAFTTLTYVMMNVAYFFVLPKAQMLQSKVVAADFAESAFGKYSCFLPLMVAVTVIGSLNSTIFCSSRFMQAAARRGHLPKFLSVLNRESNSPRVSLIGQFILAAVFCCFDCSDLITYVSFVIWGQKAATLTALIYIRHNNIPVADGVIRMPLALIYFFWSISIVLFISPLYWDLHVSLIGASLLVIGLIIYYFLIRRKSLPSFVGKIDDFLGRMACRLLNCQYEDASMELISKETEDENVEPLCTMGDRKITPKEFVDPMDPFMITTSSTTTTTADVEGINEVDIIFEKNK